jgi:hypothetical protein
MPGAHLLHFFWDTLYNWSINFTPFPESELHTAQFVNFFHIMPKGIARSKILVGIEMMNIDSKIIKTRLVEPWLFDKVMGHLTYWYLKQLTIHDINGPFGDPECFKQPYTGSTRPILKIVVPKFISEMEYIFDIIDGVKIWNIAIAFFGHPVYGTRTRSHWIIIMVKTISGTVYRPDWPMILKD